VLVTLHYVAGDDPILRDDAVEQLVGQLLDGSDRTLALEVFEVPGRATADDEGASATDARLAVIDAVANAAATPPFMTEVRVVVLRDIGLLRAAEVDRLLHGVGDLLPSTQLVLVAGGGKTPKAIDDAVKGSGARHAPEVTKPADVLARALDDARLALRADAAKVVLDHVGNDAGLVPGIVELLAAAHGPDRTLTLAEVTPYLGDAGSVPIWGLTNAIEKGEVAAALEVLTRLMTVTTPTQPKPMHPLQVVGLLHSQYRKLLSLDDPGTVRTAEDAAAILGGNPRAAQFRLRQARSLGTDGLRQAFDLLAQADLDLKGERAIPEQVVIEVLVARLAQLNGRSASERSSSSRARRRSRT
jgi:DNA polymerase III subunit delta